MSNEIENQNNCAVFPDFNDEKLKWGPKPRVMPNNFVKQTPIIDVTSTSKLMCKY